MSVHVSIVDGPVPAMAAREDLQDVGSFLVFEGIVRREEGDGEVMALSYEVYEPMASRKLRGIGEELVERHGLTSLRVEHSRGVVPVGSASLRVVIQSKHREESLAAMAAFIDQLKRDAPIWKMPVWREPPSDSTPGTAHSTH
jgi:molybdopterin synthase catalytic subunit